MDKTESKLCHHAAITDVGCVRELNEDSLFCDGHLFLVADGMGGHACGEVASQLAVDEIKTHFAQSAQLSEAIQSAHHKILDAAGQGVGQSGMGTTLVALVNRTDQYEIAWVGDSRAYLWNPASQQLTQISEDHSLMVRLIKSGLISEEEAQNHPQRHMITQCLGSLDIADVKVDSRILNWKPGQQVLLCSDGLSDELTDAQISAVMNQPLTAEEKLQDLTDAAKRAGGKDNISIVLVEAPQTSVESIVQKCRLWVEKIRSKRA